MKMKNKMKQFMLGIIVFSFAVMLNPTEAFAKNVGDKDVLFKVEDRSYATTQGMCRDKDKNIYFAKINRETKAVKVFKMGPDGTQTEILYQPNMLGHANDMTYCSADGNIYIVTGGDSNRTPEHDIVVINKKGKVVKKYNVQDMEIDNPCAIAYDSVTGVFYVAKGTKVHCGHFDSFTGKFITDSKFLLPLEGYANYVHQGIAAYNNRIYAAYYGKHLDRRNSVIIRFKINETKTSAELKRVISFDNPSRTYFEIEALDFNPNNGRMFFITNSSKGNGSYDEIYRIDDLPNFLAR